MKSLAASALTGVLLATGILAAASPPAAHASVSASVVAKKCKPAKAPKCKKKSVTPQAPAPTVVSGKGSTEILLATPLAGDFIAKVTTTRSETEPGLYVYDSDNHAVSLIPSYSYEGNGELYIPSTAARSVVKVVSEGGDDFSWSVEFIPADEKPIAASAGGSPFSEVLRLVPSPAERPFYLAYAGWSKMQVWAYLADGTEVPLVTTIRPDYDGPLDESHLDGLVPWGDVDYTLNLPPYTEFLYIQTPVDSTYGENESFTSWKFL